MKIDDPAVNELMMSEETNRDEAGYKIYQLYASLQGGILWFIAMSVVVVIWIIFNTSFNIWLTIWTGDTEGKHTDDYYLGIYITIGVLYGLAAFVRALIMAFSSPRMSAIIH